MKSSSRPRMGRVISIIAPDGGNGKTTLCANVSAALARLGKETIAVDADIAQRQLSVAMGLEDRISFSLVDVMEKACELAEACLRHGEIPCLQLFPLARHAHDMAVVENMKPDLGTIHSAFDALRRIGDFVVIDSPPSNGGRLGATVTGDEIVVVVMPRWHTVRFAERLIEPAMLRGKYNIRLVINHMRSENLLPPDGMLEANEILEILQLDLLGIVPEDECVAASGHGGEFAAFNPGSPAGQEYRNIARRLLGEEVPFGTFKR